MSSTKVTRVSLSLEPELLAALDSKASEYGYENRSEFVRDLLRDKLIDSSISQGQNSAIATILIIYNHHIPHLNEKLVVLQHEFTGTVYASTHVHVAEHLCAEVVIVSGKCEDIRILANNMQKLRGVLHAKLSFTADPALFETRNNHVHTHKH